MKKIFSLLLAIVLILGLSSCKKTEENKKIDDNGFNASTHVSSGGAVQTDTNAKDIAVEVLQNGDVSISFKFVSGSSEVGQETACGVPQYTVAFLPNPLRLIVTIDNLRYWDYLNNSVCNDESGLVLGMFHVVPVNNVTNTPFYFNLSKDVTYSVNASADGTLKITLRPQASTGMNGFYVASNLYYEFRSGALSEGAGLSPTLCSDHVSVIMISERFDTAAAAQEAQKVLEDSYSANFSGKELRVIELKGHTLPDYDDKLDVNALLSATILNMNNKNVSLPLFFADARFLCWLPDGATALFSKPENASEKLYLADHDGTKRLLIDNELAMVSAACFSKDGNTLAYVEQIGDIQLCSIYNIVTKQLTMLDDESIFGSIISGIALNDDGTKLYAMTGSSMLTLKEYDIAAKTARSLTFDGGLETDIKYNNGYIYYIAVVDDWEHVVRQNVANGEVQDIGIGVSYRLSPDGQLAAVTSNANGNEEGLCNLSLVKLTNGAKTVIAQNAVIGDFFFSSDSASVYFITANNSDTTFIYNINRFIVATAETKELAKSINAVFYASNQANEVIINVMYSKQDGDYPATYIAKF